MDASRRPFIHVLEPSVVLPCHTCFPMRMRWARTIAITAAAHGIIAAAPWSTLSAQDAPVAGTCDGKLVSSIVITAQDPSFLAVPRPLRELARTGLIHTTTKADVIARFLLLEVGKPCTELNRSESERILRRQPFIAGASVRTVPETAGAVRVEVETIDEVSTVFAMHFRGARPTAVRFGNGNVGGQALFLAASAERRRGYRSGVAVQGAAYQALGEPYTLALSAERAPLGGSFVLALGYPFLTALQRSAWHAGFTGANRYDDYVRPAGDAVALGVNRRFWDLGGVRRIAFLRHAAYVGLLLSHESVTPADRAVIALDSGIVVSPTALLGGPFPSYRNLRFSGVVGARNLTFLPVRGLDALDAVQDVANGVQVGALAGYGVDWFGGGDNDYFVSTDVYAGNGSQRSFAAVRLVGETRYDRRTNDWDSAIASGRAAWYVKPAPAHVLVGSLEFGGGRRARLPFQLALGDPDGGVRGHSDSRLAGAMRAVARVEERWTIGAPTQRCAFGLASFVDAGRVWAGDAPFGVNSRTKAGVGAGLLATVPRQSPRMFRLDLALPLQPDSRARWELRLSSVYTRVFWREPGAVTRGRAGAAPSTIFGWP
jgi:hypothetical protein